MGTVRGYLMALGAVLAGVLVVVLVGTTLARAGTTPGLLTATVNGTAQTPVGVLPHAFLELASYPDSMAGEHGPGGGSEPDWVSYGPTTNLSVPAHSLVTVTIKQYDSGGTITNAWFAQVHGTVDGTITVNGKTTKSLNPDVIGHTFTIHALPTNQDPLFVSVPLPALSDAAEAKLAPGSNYPAPDVVTFSFVTGGAGNYVWNCEYPCGDGTYAKFGGPMSSRGYMSGTLTVT
ncbi:MAG: hypothetical protein ABI899_10090 [Actinomycetota bacterium]